MGLPGTPTVVAFPAPTQTACASQPPHPSLAPSPLQSSLSRQPPSPSPGKTNGLIQGRESPRQSSMQLCVKNVRAVHWAGSWGSCEGVHVSPLKSCAGLPSRPDHPPTHTHIYAHQLHPHSSSCFHPGPWWQPWVSSIFYMHANTLAHVHLCTQPHTIHLNTTHAPFTCVHSHTHTVQMLQMVSPLTMQDAVALATTWPEAGLSPPAGSRDTSGCLL